MNLLSTLKLRAIALGLVATVCSVAAAADYPHLKMGNPSDAAKDKNNYLMQKDFFALSYNNHNGTPNWVSWRLTDDDLGDAPRKPFKPDKTLPADFKQIIPKDYTGGGFDRGHQCPHSDRSASDEMSAATFVMTNMAPQSPELNQKAWAQLEMYCRHLVEDDNKVLYIVCGPHGKGGVGREGAKTSIGGERKIAVPKVCWKAVLVVDKGKDDDIKKVDKSTRIISVIMPNDDTVRYDWGKFRCPLGEIEDLTGYKLFSNVPDSVMDELRDVVDDEVLPEPEIPHHGH
jgi:endonuclease G